MHPHKLTLDLPSSDVHSSPHSPRSSRPHLHLHLSSSECHAAPPSARTAIKAANQRSELDAIKIQLLTLQDHHTDLYQQYKQLTVSSTTIENKYSNMITRILVRNFMKGYRLRHTLTALYRHMLGLSEFIRHEKLTAEQAEQQPDEYKVKVKFEDVAAARERKEELLSSLIGLQPIKIILALKDYCDSLAIEMTEVLKRAPVYRAELKTLMTRNVELKEEMMQLEKKNAKYKSKIGDLELEVERLQEINYKLQRQNADVMRDMSLTIRMEKQKRLRENKSAIALRTEMYKKIIKDPHFHLNAKQAKIMHSLATYVANDHSNGSNHNSSSPPSHVDGSSTSPSRSPTTTTTTTTSSPNTHDRAHKHAASPYLPAISAPLTTNHKDERSKDLKKHSSHSSSSPTSSSPPHHDDTSAYYLDDFHDDAAPKQMCEEKHERQRERERERERQRDMVEAEEKEEEEEYDDFDDAQYQDDFESTQDDTRAYQYESRPGTSDQHTNSSSKHNNHDNSQSLEQHQGIATIQDTFASFLNIAKRSSPLKSSPLRDKASSHEPQRDVHDKAYRDTNMWLRKNTDKHAGSPANTNNNSSITPSRSTLSGSRSTPALHDSGTLRLPSAIKSPPSNNNAPLYANNALADNTTEQGKPKHKRGFSHHLSNRIKEKKQRERERHKKELEDKRREQPLDFAHDFKREAPPSPRREDGLF